MVWKAGSIHGPAHSGVLLFIDLIRFSVKSLPTPVNTASMSFMLMRTRLWDFGERILPHPASFLQLCPQSIEWTAAPFRSGTFFFPIQRLPLKISYMCGTILRHGPSLQFYLCKPDTSRWQQIWDQSRLLYTLLCQALFFSLGIFTHLQQ